MKIPVKISIVIPTYNRSKLISRAIKSLLSQTVLPHEIIVVDDGSTDDTKTIIDEFNKSHPFITYIYGGKNAGAQHARNIGIKNIKGDYVLLFDSDNELDKNYCRLVNDFLNQKPKTDVLTNFSKVLNENTNHEESFAWITQGGILKDLLCGKTYMDYNSAIIKKEKLLVIGALDEYCPSFQEWDTAIRLAKICEFDCIPQQLTIYHKHAQERISNSINREVAGRYYVLEKHKKLWLKEAGKEAYLKYLGIVYQTAIQNGLCDYEWIVRKEINEIDPFHFQKKRYHRLVNKIKNRLGHYRHIALNKIS